MKVPSALIDSLIETKGFDKEAFEKVHQSGEQITSVRFNAQKPVDQSTIFSVENNNEAIAFTSVPWNANGYYLSSRPSLLQILYFMEGLTMFKKQVVCFWKKQFVSQLIFHNL